jgi:hypothetical protein
MAKMIKIIAVCSIKYDEITYLPGETFSCDVKEAERLKGLEVAIAASAVSTSAAAQTGPTAAELEAQEKARQAELAQQQADLLALISAAQSREELELLIPEEEPADPDFALKLREAFTARTAELEA